MLIISSYILFFLVLSVYGREYLLFVFNKPVSKEEYVIKQENQELSIFVSKKVVEQLIYDININNYFAVNINGKYYYDLKKIILDNNSKFVLFINKETGIIDVNNIKRKNIQTLDVQEAKINSNYQLDSNFNNDLVKNKWEYKKYETKYFIVYYTNEQIKIILNNLVDYYYEEFIKFMGFIDYYNFSVFFGEKIPIYLAPNDDIYRSYDMVPEWSSGAFVINFDYYNLARASIYAHEKDPLLIQRVLPHEISHLVMYRYLNIINAPINFKFILEGIAQYQEYRIITGLDYINYIPTYKISFNNLLYPNFSSNEEIRNFYDNSLAFTCFLINSFGINKYREFIKELKISNDVLSSLNKVYKLSLGYSNDNIIKEIEKKWQYYIQNTTPTPIK